MSEEEKKAIDNLRLNCTNLDFYSPYDGTTLLLKARDIQVVLNYISNLQKEKSDLELAYGLYKDKSETLQKELDNRIPVKNIEKILKKHKKAMKLASEQISERIIIADSDSLNCGRKEAHNLIISDLIDLLNKE